MLDASADGAVEVCVLVDSTGTVREAGISRPAAPFDEAALEAARWWLFAPARAHGRPVPARIPVIVAAHVPRDADPLVPDVVALARDAERRGDLRGALDAWTGVLARVGTHPALQNEWAIREQLVRLAARLPKPPEVDMTTVARARSMHNLMLRNVARGANEDYARALDEVLLVAPWYADAYRWRASARAASGQRDGAVRDVLCYRLAARDSVGRALAERALVALASADTLAAMTMLKN
jgi:TonB family protein